MSQKGKNSKKGVKAPPEKEYCAEETCAAYASLQCQACHCALCKKCMGEVHHCAQSTPTESKSGAKPVLTTGLRTHTCGELRMSHVGQTVTLCGWVQTNRDMNHFVFVDLRDRYGITQCVFSNPGTEPKNEDEKGKRARYEVAQKLGREYVISVTGKVVERSNKNKQRDTGDIEIEASKIDVVNPSLTPPFLIEDKTDGGEEVRARFRYLDIRRNPVLGSLVMRAKVCHLVRNYLTSKGFLEVETPVLIKSTPEGARDFIVPSRMNPGQFYALPQSPQTFKQILMVGGCDRYFQITKCFRDEELRADRQPEFTQIDCEMSYITQQDILDNFEGLIRVLFREIAGHEFPPMNKMTWHHAMEFYGIDKPDLRFDMKLKDLTKIVKGKGLKMFDEAEIVIAICCEGQGDMTSKKIKDLEKDCKSTLIGAKAMVWVKVTNIAKKEFSSSVSKFYDNDELAKWAAHCGAKDGDLMIVFCGAKQHTRECMGKLRHEMGTRMGLRSKGFQAHWVVDFPLLEWNEEEKRFNAMHHPFTSPKKEDFHLMDTNPGETRANAYDMVINGVEVGGGSIRIHQKELQHKLFKLLGFTKEAAEEQFGFLLNAFEYGAPPHGGLAFGLDRLCTILGGATSIRDYIAFPKNNMGRDTMINSPSEVSQAQLDELKIASTFVKEEKK